VQQQTTAPNGSSAGERAATAAIRRPRPAGPEFVSAGVWKAPAGRHAGPHSYAVWKLTYYREGRIDAFVDGVRHPVGPGSVLAIAPRGLHAERAHTGYANTYLLINAPASWPWPALVEDDDEGTLGRCFAAVVRESASAGRHSAAMIGALLTQIDVVLRRAGRATSAAGDPVTVAEQIMATEHTGPLRIADLALRVGVAVSTLRAHFAAELGTSPQARLLQIRLQHATDLLGTSDLTVEAIAARCGFHSASHLSRRLRADTGRSPGQFRGSRPARSVPWAE
jgi:AraC-like DNA-binding protein